VPLGRRLNGPGVDTAYRSYGLDAKGSIEGIEDQGGDTSDCEGNPDPASRSDGYRYDPYGELESDESKLSAEAAVNPLRFEAASTTRAARPTTCRPAPTGPTSAAS
jgi:hypothetical protein